MDWLCPDRTSDCQRTITNFALSWHSYTRQTKTLNSFRCRLFCLLFLLFLCFLWQLILSLLFVLLCFACFDICLYDLFNFSSLILQPIWLAIYTLIHRAVFQYRLMAANSTILYSYKKPDIKVNRKRHHWFNHFSVSVSHLRYHMKDHS